MSQPAISVDASGLDAVAIGSAVIGLGVINLALGIRSRRRIHVFWMGAALFLLPTLYGLWKVALGIYQLVPRER
jgi:glucose dehydrogenase